jgi:hypothetical protein
MQELCRKLAIVGAKTAECAGGYISPKSLICRTPALTTDAFFICLRIARLGGSRGKKQLKE